MVAVYVIVGVLVVLAFALAMSVRIIKQYERVVLFKLGKVSIDVSAVAEAHFQPERSG